MRRTEPFRILPAGDAALLVEFGEGIDERTNEWVRALHLALGRGVVPGVAETVPAYRSLLVCYRPEEIRWEEISARLERVVGGLEPAAAPPAERIEIPVLYGGGEGPDLGFVAQYSGRTEDEVVRIHTKPDYRVYMLGFLPGFPYLGGMDPSIAAPRLETPRTEIPAGSVGIAGEQTGVYPLASPGGWRLIGRTPLRLYDPGREPPILLQAGQYVRFRGVGRAEYDEIEERMRASHGDFG